MNNFKKLTVAVVSLMMICTSMGGFAFGTSADDENVYKKITLTGDTVEKGVHHIELKDIGDCIVTTGIINEIEMTNGKKVHHIELKDIGDYTEIIVDQ